MKIRKMQATDIDRIAAITTDAWPATSLRKQLEDRYGMAKKTEWRQKKAADVRSFCLSNPARVIVAVENDTVIGYATFSIDAEDGVGHILNNAVDPAHQGKGIGTAMIAWLIEHFRHQGLSIARVSTSVNNVAAQKLYEKQGFKELARTIHYSRAL